MSQCRTVFDVALAVPAGLPPVKIVGEVQKATNIGLLDPDGPGSWTYPHLSRMLYADGKVVTPLFRAKPGDKKVDKRTGKVSYPRAEHDAALHVEGTGEMVWERSS